MNKVNRRTLLFTGFLLLVLHQFSALSLEGQVSTEGRNGTFLLIIVPILFGTIYMNRLWGYLTVFSPIRNILYLIAVVIFLFGLIRGDLSNVSSILLTYGLIIGLSVLAFSLPFHRVINLFVIFVGYIFLPLAVYYHLSNIGQLALFPDRAEDNNLRLGGLLYYAHTAMVLGIGGLMALYQFFAYSSSRMRFYFGFTFVLLNIFLLFTDCRSSWGGVTFAYLIIILAHLPTKARQRIIVIGCLASLVMYSGIFSQKKSSQYQTKDDFAFRTMIWGFALEGIIDEPILGYGKVNYFTRNRKAMELDERTADPHSATLSLALQSGLPVVLLFYVLYYTVTRKYYRFSIDRRKSLLSITAFWFFVPFFWGTIYNGAAGFIQIIFPLTYFVGLLHPDLYFGRKDPLTTKTQDSVVMDSYMDQKSLELTLN